MPQLSVVVPVFNERDNIVPLIEEIVAALRGAHDFEIVYVDDASRDDSLSVLRDARARFAELRVVRHLSQSGQSTAVRTGVKAARGTWVATLDGDGQNDPADLPALWALVEARAGAAPSLVCGHRVRRHDDWLRRWSSRIANGVRRRVLGDHTPDTGCGLKLVRRTVYLELPYFDHMHRFLPALVQQAGGRTVSVPVRHRSRRHGKSNYGIGNRLWAGLVDLAGVVWLGRRNRHVDYEEISPQ